LAWWSMAGIIITNGWRCGTVWFEYSGSTA